MKDVMIMKVWGCGKWKTRRNLKENIKMENKLK
jgi:hypothetical protein